MPTLKRSHILIPALMLLSACGGGSGGCTPSDGRPLDTTTDTSASCANKGPAANIAITYPNVNAIEHLADASGFSTGVYSYSGSVVVTDENGNAVADDTIVQLDVIDSIMAQGTIDSLSASSLTDANPTITDDGGIGAADFTTAHIREGGASFFIDTQSIVILTDAANREDQARLVTTTIANTVTVNSAYNSTYPNTVYPAGTTDYIIGRTTLGMKILGVDPDTAEKTEGVAKTKNGIASFRIEYPANTHTIRAGCENGLVGGIPAIDTRFPTPSTRDVWVRATAGSEAITVVDDRACFKHILPQGFGTAAATIVPGVLVPFTIQLTDAENVGLPFYTINPIGSGTGTACVTNSTGYCTVTVSGADGDTVTYAPPANAGTGDFVVSIKVP